MANESRKKTLVDKIARLEKDIIDLVNNINKKTAEIKKLIAEASKSNTTDSRKKTIITKVSTLEKEIITLSGRHDTKVKEHNKAVVELNSLN